MEITLAKTEHTKQMNRDRQKRFYDANKERINAVKQTARDSLMRPIKITEVKPVIEPKRQNPNPFLFDEETVIQMINDMEMNEQTRRKKISNVKIIFNAYPSTDLKTSLNHYDKMRNALETVKQIKKPNETYGYETMKTVVQTILWCIINLKIPIKDEIFKKYESLVGILKQKSIDHKTESKNDVENAVLPYNEYLNKIKASFGEDSKAFLIASIYSEITARDDIASIEIITQLKQIKNNQTNILFLPKQGNGQIILNNYKTQNKYGTITTPLTCDLTHLLRKYIIKHQLIKKLFPENFDNGLTSYISRMNKTIGIDGGINILRRMKITDFMNKPNLTMEERAIFANNSMHSLDMQQYYKYQQKTDFY